MIHTANVMFSWEYLSICIQNQMQHLQYMALVRPILGYGEVCWDPYREGHVSALNQVQTIAAKFANNMSRVEKLWHSED